MITAALIIGGAILLAAFFLAGAITIAAERFNVHVSGYITTSVTGISTHGGEMTNLPFGGPIEIKFKEPE